MINADIMAGGVSVLFSLRQRLPYDRNAEIIFMRWWKWPSMDWCRKKGFRVTGFQK